MTNEEPSNDEFQPNIVWARDFKGGDPPWITLLAHPETIQRWLAMGDSAKVAEYAGLVHGRFGDGGPVGSRGLKTPSQIHRGLKRPLSIGEADIGSDILIYVTEPPHTYRYTRNEIFPEVTAKPRDSVFTTFVSTDPRVIDRSLAAMRRSPPRPVDGVVLFWEWTVASEGAGSASFISAYEEHVL